MSDDANAQVSRMVCSHFVYREPDGWKRDQPEKEEAHKIACCGAR